MIYLQNISESQVLFVPKNGSVPGGSLVFKAKSTIDLETEILQDVIDLNTSDLYFNIAVSLPGGLPNGEYEYTLTDGVQVLSTGLLIIGESASASQYNKEITYEQYETE